MTTETPSPAFSRTDVLVIGAGPTGLTAAAEARRHGLSVRIIDKNESRTPFSKALVVHSRTLELFSDMGLVWRVLARGREFRALNLYADQKPLARILFQQLDWQDAPYPFWLSIPQSETEHCLEEHLSSFGVHVERRTELSSFSQHPDHVSAKLRRADGQFEECEAAWMVGADGARSQVRSALGIDFEGSASDEVFILADVTMESQLADAEGYNLMAKEGITLIVPMPTPKRVRLIFHMPNLSPNDKADITLPLLQSLLDQRTGFTTQVSELGWTAQFFARHFVAKHHRQGRVFLAGDAAHVHSPVGGQGLNTGIQDAYNLMWKLALHHKGQASDALLDSYESERHTIAAATIKNVKRATQLVTLRSSIAQGLRNQLAHLLMSTDTVQDRMGRDVGMLTLSYEKSPVVAEDLPATGLLSSIARTLVGGDSPDFATGPGAGELAPSVDFAAEPDAPLRFLDALQGTHYSLVFFAADDAPAQAASWNAAVAQIRSRYSATINPLFVLRGTTAPPPDLSGVALRDREGALHSRYGAQSPCLYLVRPDKYVAYRCQPVDFAGLFAYLDRVLIPQSS